MPGLYLRSHIWMQHDSRLHRRRLRTLQGNVALLGRRWQAHAQQPESRGPNSFRQLCQRPLLCCADRPRLHDQVPTGMANHLVFIAGIPLVS